jgi:probable HAF family extracellular repeat protein
VSNYAAAYARDLLELVIPTKALDFKRQTWLLCRSAALRMKTFFSLFLLPCCVFAATTRPQFEVIEVTSAYEGNLFYFGPFRINNSNQIVGAFPTPAGNAYHGFLWQNGMLDDLGLGIAKDINDFGHYIGNVTSAVFQTVFPSLIPYAINNAGQVVGESEHHAFISDSNGLVLFPEEGFVQQSVAVAVNNSGVATGRAVIDSAPRRAFLFTANGSMAIGPTLKLHSSQGVGINDAGHVLLQATQTNGHTKRIYSYLYRDGELTPLPSLPGYRHLNAEAINNANEVVGFVGRTVHDHGDAGLGSFVVSLSAAFLYSNGTSYNLNRLLKKSSRGWHVIEGIDINDTGSIVALASRANTRERVVLLRRMTQ